MTSELRRSYELIGRVFTTLISNGLSRTDLDPDDFGLGDDNDPANLWGSVMECLIHEGLVRNMSEPLLDGQYPGVQLTSRGIAAIEDNRFSESGSISSAVEEGSAQTSDETAARIGAFIAGLPGSLRPISRT